MRPFIAKEVPREDFDLYLIIRQVVEALPDEELNLGQFEVDGTKVVMTCHLLARAVSVVLGLEFQDGNFYQICDHSWVLTKAGNIVDVYPVGAWGPSLVWNDPCFSVGKWLYKPVANFSTESPELKLEDPGFRESVLTVVTALVETMDRLKIEPPFKPVF